ncbi:MAG: hypothetical protein P8X77_12710 [Maritimibacter sp.]
MALPFERDAQMGWVDRDRGVIGRIKRWRDSDKIIFLTFGEEEITHTWHRVTSRPATPQDFKDHPGCTYPKVIVWHFAKHDRDRLIPSVGSLSDLLTDFANFVTGLSRRAYEIDGIFHQPIVEVEFDGNESQLR